MKVFQLVSRLIEVWWSEMQTLFNKRMDTGTCLLLPLYFTVHPMVRGKTIPEDLHWVVIQLESETTMTEDEIAMYTDISVRSVRKILTFFQCTGSVNFPKKQIAFPQLHKLLCDYDIKVYITLFFRHC